MKRNIRRRARRQVSRFSPDDSTFMVHSIVQFELDVDPELVSMLAERGAEGTEGPGRTILQKIAEVYRAGRKVRFSTYPATFRTVIVPRDLEEAVEAALQQGDEA